ncbi:MAG: NAD(P)H-hydrate dehydratase [Rhodoferax sp.]
MKEKSTSSERILDASGCGAWSEKSLIATAQTRALEAHSDALLPPHALMQRAGLAIAKFAMALAPHAKTIWIACGPGNNGGDGYEASWHLKSWGKMPTVTCLANTNRLPPDAAISKQKALDAGVVFSDTIPTHYDLCIDALFGIGRVRPWNDSTALWINQINSEQAPVLSVDIPSGLHADTGEAEKLHVRAHYTLSLLTLKPGLFTADGREACGEIWFDALGMTNSVQACAQLNSEPVVITRAHNTHKGSYGDVWVVGGGAGMTGAALLAAQAALYGGSGRVYVSLLDVTAIQLDISQPELMFRAVDDVAAKTMTVVAGCGGSKVIAQHLTNLVTDSARLVLDADGLNALALDSTLQTLLSTRPPLTTVLTPHPLEAARLMNISTSKVQANRLEVAQTLADRFACIVVLKGSGTVIAAPATLPRVNISGNARLATAGTGDVLAGLIAARLAAGGDAFARVCEAVFHHGQIANTWSPSTPLTAQALARAL